MAGQVTPLMDSQGGKRWDLPEAQRRALKRMKDKKVHGVNNIDSYSIKIGGLLMEEALLQLVNKSIEQRKFAKNWKPQLVKPYIKRRKIHWLETLDLCLI